MDVMEKERRRHRFRNRGESIHDEVDVVQVAPIEKTAVRAQLSSDRQPSGQSAWNAMGQDGLNSFRRATRIPVV